MEKRTLSFWELWNMSFGFLGIQFGWGLQLGNMSAIYEYLGAQPDEIPILWLAAPVTGLIVQPIIGYYSDKTWTKLGRRKPYFLTGAILASVALIFMPHSSSLWMAAGLLWILDASINISMEPFRAFVADMLPKKQITKGYSMQSFFIGIGAIFAAILPFVFTEWLGFEKTAEEGVPMYLKMSFAIGGVAFFGAVLWTIMKTKEYSPEEMEQFHADEEKGSHGSDAILQALKGMPRIMKQLAVVQFFTWMGLFLMWFYFTVTVANDVFGAEAGSEEYADGVVWANLCFGFYSVVTFLFALNLPRLSDKIGKKYTHAICLVLGALGLLLVPYVPNKWWLFVSMTGVGLAWASILAMPYALLAPQLPYKNLGLFMGIFNFFIVLPEIIATLFFGWIMLNILDNSREAAMIVAGSMLIIAAIAALFLDENREDKLVETGGD